jgi:hypothetical protein
VGRLVGVSRSSVQRAIQAGAVKTTRRGNRHRAGEAEAERFRREVTHDLAALLAGDF